ncbi:MAG: rod shape-determining protein RodA, partial [bacterium]
MTDVNRAALGPLRRLNWVLLAGMCLLIAAGTLFVYSACSIREVDRLHALYRLHAGSAAAGLVVYLGLASVNYRTLLHWSWAFYLVALVLLAAVLMFGTSQMGARRWVFGVQPSEIAKLAVILFVAWFLGRRESSRDAAAYVATLGVAAVPVVLVMQQPDLGTALVFVPTVLAMLFTANVAPRIFWLTLLGGAAAVILVVGVVALAETRELPARTQERLRQATCLTDYQWDRVANFLFPERSPHGGAWNKRQSEIAVGSGGMWGKGFRKGDQNLLGYLPPSVSANDFIFSVLAEEVGFAGSLVILALYALVLGAVLAVAFTCPDGAGKLLCVGVAVMMFCHVFVNIAMTMGLLPITGLPLPFISYGRTCLLTMMAALGFVQSVAIHGRESAP